MEHSRILASSAGDRVYRETDVIRQRLSSALRLVDEIASPPVVRSASQTTSEREIRAIIKQRRNRDRFFDGELFADPAWDILLELFAAELGQQRLSVSGACIGASVPATTALRWIATLERSGLIDRRADPTDGRRVFLSLSDQGLSAMNGYFATVPREATAI